MDIGSAVGRKQGVSEQQLLDLDHFETSPTSYGDVKNQGVI